MATKTTTITQQKQQLVIQNDLYEQHFHYLMRIKDKREVVGWIRRVGGGVERRKTFNKFLLYEQRITSLSLSHFASLLSFHPITKSQRIQSKYGMLEFALCSAHLSRITNISNGIMRSATSKFILQNWNFDNRRAYILHVLNTMTSIKSMVKCGNFHSPTFTNSHNIKLIVHVYIQRFTKKLT